jgi:hypothetical protein
MNHGLKEPTTGTIAKQKMESSGSRLKIGDTPE